MTSKFDINDLGEANVILGVKIIGSDIDLMLTREHYVERLLRKYGNFDATPISTPYDVNTQLTKIEEILWLSLSMLRLLGV